MSEGEVHNRVAPVYICSRAVHTILSVKPFSLVDAQPGGGGKRIPMARAPGLEATRVSSTVARRPPNIGHKMVNKVAPLKL